MNRQEVRGLLLRWGSSEQIVERLEKQRQALRIWADDALDTLGTQKLTGMPGGGGVRDLSDVVCAADQRREVYAERCRVLDDELRRHVDMCARIDRAVCALEPKAQRVVQMRYMQGMRWAQIAEVMFYDERRVRQIDEQAVDRIAEMLKQDETRPEVSENYR